MTFWSMKCMGNSSGRDFVPLGSKGGKEKHLCLSYFLLPALNATGARI